MVHNLCRKGGFGEINLTLHSKNIYAYFINQHLNGIFYVSQNFI